GSPELAVQTSLTRLFDTAGAARSRCPAVSSGKSLGSQILATDFQRKIRAFLFSTFRPLYQKAGPRQEPLGGRTSGGDQSAAQGFGVFRALASGSTRRI